MLFALEEPDGETLRVPVLRVFDGDGFLTRVQIGGGREVEAAVRFGFIDAPEMGQPGGREAREFLNGIIAGQWLDLAILLKSDTGKIVDGHGRIVAVPYLRHEPSREAHPTSMLGRLLRAVYATQTFRNIELEMVLNGWAWVLDRYGPKEHYFDALEDARRHRRGIWARDDNLHPWEFKKRQHAERRRAGNTTKPTLKLSQGMDCPADGCSGKLVQRTGRFGEFVGCSQFPKCRYSFSRPS